MYMYMRMLVLTFVLFGAFTAVHNQQQGSSCSIDDADKIQSSCMKSFVCGLKMNDSCSNDKVIDCIDLKLIQKNCPFYNKEMLKRFVTTERICEFGGVDVRGFFKDASCARNASCCTGGFHQMWRNNRIDPRLNRKFDEMKICLVNLFGSEECNMTITNLEDVFDNPFKDCWDSRGSTSVHVSPITAHGGSTPTRSYGLLSAFTIMMAFILAMFH